MDSKDSNIFNLKNVGLTTALTASMLGGMISTSFADAVPTAEKTDVNKDNGYQAEQKTEANAYKVPKTKAEAKANLDKADENVKNTGKVKDAAKVANDTAKAAKDDAATEKTAADDNLTKAIANQRRHRRNTMLQFRSRMMPRQHSKLQRRNILMLTR